MKKQGYIIVCLLCALIRPVIASEVVIVLHGLARSADSMTKMADALAAAGYTVHNLDYPSRHHPIETLAAMVRCQIEALTTSEDTIHFVTHSMGGIIVRSIQKDAPFDTIGRVVMLSPPNHGSELVEALGDYSVFEWINGPAGDQLGTDPNGFIAQLGPIDFELGVITGDYSINWINSMIIPGDDDGKVSTESAKLPGMCDYRIIHATHPSIMVHEEAITATLHFLNSGRFDPE